MIAAVRAPRSKARRRSRGSSGAVALEFLLAFPPLFVMVLGVVQLALLAAADLVVRHAAIVGVRAAVVVLDDDPRHYDGTPRGRIDGVQAGSALDQRFAAQLGADAGRDWIAQRPGDGPRMAAIRTAVHAKLAAIAPPAGLLAGLAGPDVASAIGDPASRLASGLGRFVPMAAAVVFPSVVESAELQEDAVTTDPVVLRVTYLLPCAVPIARMLLCRKVAWDARAQRLTIIDADAATRRALDDLRHAPDASAQASLALLGVPVAVLAAEASLPLQAAPYAYAGERTEP